MKPFNLEEAKAGKPVCTRDGRDARIISVDLDGDMPIVAALWNREHSEESAVQFYQNGAFLSCRDTGFDLFMKEEEPKHCCGDACGDNRFEIIEKAKETLLKGTNIESSPEEMTVLDNFLFRCWQMGWLEQYGPTGAKVKEPTLDDYTTIKTYEDACKALDIVPISSIIISSKGEGFWPDTQRCPKHILALMKLETISRALWGREWQPKPDAKRHKQYFLPQFAFYSQEEIIDEEKGDSFLPIHSNNEPNTFLGLMYTHYVISNSVAHNNFRLCQETTEKARYFGKQFIELWAEYLGFNF